MSVLLADRNFPSFHVVIATFPSNKNWGLVLTSAPLVPLTSRLRRADQAVRRWAASSSASSLFSLISASVRTKRVHSSFRGTAICWWGDTTQTWLTFQTQVCATSIFIDNNYNASSNQKKWFEFNPQDTLLCCAVIHCSTNDSSQEA